MRFIYLSTTYENELFGTWSDALDFFRDYLTGEEEIFNISKGKIDKNKFDVGEDIFFLIPEKVYGYYTYMVIAYATAGGPLENTGKVDYPQCFKIDAESLKIFTDGIDIRYLQNFIDDATQNLSKRVNLSGNINNNQFTGSSSWVYFDATDSKIIMDWFKEITIDEPNFKYIAKW